MSKIKEIRSNPKNNTNLVDFISLVTPKDKTAKYADTFIKIIRNDVRFKNYAKECSEYIRDKFPNTDNIEDFNEVQLLFFTSLTSLFSDDVLLSLKRFTELNERGLIAENDLSRYKSFDEIQSALSIAEIKVVEKEMENQILKIHEDDEWLVIRPLTFVSSKKYGSSTTWCTTTYNNPEYFIKYSSNGILIYILNKKTGIKVATYYSLTEAKEFSFWNQVDVRVDSLQSNLPKEILDIIMEIVKKEKLPNIKYLSKEYLKKEQMIGRKGGSILEHNVPPQRTIAIEDPDGYDLGVEEPPLVDLYENAREEFETRIQSLRPEIDQLNGTLPLPYDEDVNETVSEELPIHDVRRRLRLGLLNASNVLNNVDRIVENNTIMEQPEGNIEYRLLSGENRGGLLPNDDMENYQPPTPFQER